MKKSSFPCGGHDFQVRHPRCVFTNQQNIYNFSLTQPLLSEYSYEIIKQS